MKIFIAGGSGVLGSRLVTQFVSSGHEVVAMTRSPGKTTALSELGAEVAVADAFDREAVTKAVMRAEPEIVIHQMTALTGVTSLRRFDHAFALTNRLRTEGTDHLLDAALAARARRFIVQSYGGWNYARGGSIVKNEDDYFDPSPPKAQRQSLSAFRHLESAVLGADGIEGVVLRYANFYGPGTSLSRDGEMTELVRKRRLPIIGAGTGIWSFLHIDDAATATAAVAERGDPGVYNVADDEPAPVSDWLPALAAAIGAKPPQRIPLWLGRLVAGEVVVSMMTRIRGISNAKAKRELGWSPRYPSYREGFTTGLGNGQPTSVSRARKIDHGAR
jgi:nucleoside-diphosphate-sugar epimerase